MIDKPLQEVLSEIESNRQSYRAWEKDAEHRRDNEKTERESAERSEKEMKKYELIIEKLSLELRKILNGTPSEIPVSAPEVGEPEQVGREG